MKHLTAIPLGEVAAARSETFWHQLWRERSARRGVVLIGLVIVAALCAPLVAALLGHGETQQFRDTALSEIGIPVGPSLAFPLGADDNGRDVLVRTLYGARVSLMVAIPATTLAMLIGTTIGLFSGFFAGKWDKISEQCINIVLSFPFIVTALSLLTFNRNTSGDTRVDPMWVVILIIAFFSWGYFARLTRGLVLGIKHQGFVEAAQVMGTSKLRIIVREILPNVIPTLVVYWAVQLPANIIAEATLSFLGVGIPAPHASLGNMISDVQRSAMYQVQPWFLIGPALALFISVLGFNSLSSGLRNVLDPHLRQR